MTITTTSTGGTVNVGSIAVTSSSFSNTATATVSSTANIAEGDVLTSSGGASLTATEGQSVSGTVATFTDSNPNNVPGDFIATIDWGDGTTTTGTVIGSPGSSGTTTSSTLTVSGSHTYADEGSFAVKVTLSDDAPGTASASATGTATVAEGDVLTRPTVASLTATEGQSVSETATFTDATYPSNNPGDFNATIDWGDGTTTTGTVSGSSSSSSTLTVNGSHTYTNAGSFAIKVTLIDDSPGTESAIATGTATIVVPSFVVTNTNIDGQGSLRQAIMDANSITGSSPRIITFAVTTPAPFVLQLKSPLPTITKPVIINDSITDINPMPFVIDGSQAGINPDIIPDLTNKTAPDPIIERDLPGSTLIDINAPNSTIQGLTVYGSKGFGIVLDGLSAGSKLLDNFIGTDPTGTAIRGGGNQLGGVFVLSGNNVISRNVISGNGDMGNSTDPNSLIGFGVAFFGTPAKGSDSVSEQVGGLTASGNLLTSNHIGTDRGGMKALPNFDGVDLSGVSGTMITGNYISGNGTTSSPVAAGIYLFNNATHNVIQGNWIGVGNENVAIPNRVGVAIANSSNNFVEGSNIIANNDQSGVIISTSGANAVATANVVTGNTIRNNRQNGVYILHASGNQVGMPMAGNVIQRNGFSGVEIEGAAATGNVVRSNQIQNNVNNGVYLFNASNNTIGGTVGVSGNTILNNGGSGVFIDSMGFKATQNQVQGNTITGSINFGVLIRDATGNVIVGNVFRGNGLGSFQFLPTGGMGGNTFANTLTGPTTGPTLAISGSGTSSRHNRSRGRSTLQHGTHVHHAAGPSTSLHPAGPLRLLSSRVRHPSKAITRTP